MEKITNEPLFRLHPLPQNLHHPHGHGTRLFLDLRPHLPLFFSLFQTLALFLTLITPIVKFFLASFIICTFVSLPLFCIPRACRFSFVSQLYSDTGNK